MKSSVKIIVLAGFLFAQFFLCTGQKTQPPVPLYKNPQAPIEARVKDLMSRMTLEEKCAQLEMNSLQNQEKRPQGFGFSDSPFVGVEDIAKASYKAKKYALENTRLGIPIIQIAECLHGQLAYGATIYPQAIAQGSTWNPGLIKQMGEAIAAEAHLSGVDMALSPLFDLIRDARYGRVEECYGEAPFLVGKIGSAFVTGMQGDPEQTRTGIAKNKIMCTAKHFAGYSVPAAGINLAPASLGEREMRSLHLQAFQMVVEDANIYSVMPSYNDVDGIPAHASKFLLSEVLRDEWNFKGIVFSDYGSVGHLYNFHKVAAGKPEAAIMAIKAGVDVEAARPDAYATLKELVEQNKLDVAYIDLAVERILTVKFKAGLFDKPLPDPKTIKSKVHTKDQIALSQQIAEESIILLQNENNLLPLDASVIKSLAVIGPNADQVQYGDYSWSRDNSTGVTILQGIREVAGGKVKINYAKGCNISGLGKDGFKEAIDAANNSDAVVMVMGGTSVILSGLGWGKGPGEFENEEPFTCGEGYDLTDLDPLGVQRDLIRELKKTGKPIVLVMVHGRPWTIKWEKENIPAILEAWYPGERGGIAVANILFGKVNPSGKLNCTVPQSVGHIPVTYDYKAAAKGINREPGTPEKAGRDYVFSSPDPLFAFGHGLSYTTFGYSNLEVSKLQFGINDELTVNVDVTNTGKREGKEVVQLYIHDKVSSVTTPVVQLKGFDKIGLSPGETRTVTFKLKAKDFGLWNAEMKFVTEPGEFDILIGKSAVDIVDKVTVNYF